MHLLQDKEFHRPAKQRQRLSQVCELDEQQVRLLCKKVVPGTTHLTAPSAAGGAQTTRSSSQAASSDGKAAGTGRGRGRGQAGMGGRGRVWGRGRGGSANTNGTGAVRGSATAKTEEAASVRAQRSLTRRLDQFFLTEVPIDTATATARRMSGAASPVQTHSELPAAGGKGASAAPVILSLTRENLQKVQQRLRHPERAQQQEEQEQLEMLRPDFAYLCAYDYQLQRDLAHNAAVNITTFSTSLSFRFVVLSLPLLHDFLYSSNLR